MAREIEGAEPGSDLSRVTNTLPAWVDRTKGQLTASTGPQTGPQTGRTHDLHPAEHGTPILLAMGADLSNVIACFVGSAGCASAAVTRGRQPFATVASS